MSSGITVKMSHFSVPLKVYLQYCCHKRPDSIKESE